MSIVMIIWVFLFIENQYQKPILSFEAEFEMDLDRDGLMDYISLSSGKVALSSYKFKIKRISKFHPFYAMVKGNEIWIGRRGKALAWDNGKIIIRDLSMKEQLWWRVYRIEPYRASLLTLNLLLTLLTIIISVEKIYRVIIFIFEKSSRDKGVVNLENIVYFVLPLIFAVLLFLTKSYLYVVWLWILPAFSYFRNFLLSRTFLGKFIGLIGIPFIFFFLYFSYFGLWIPVF